MELINDLKKYVVVVPKKKTNIDNFVFKFQYIGLKWILILCALISMRNYFGDWINCTTETDLQDVVNKFCFFTGTYTFKNGSVKGLFSSNGRNEIMYHKYYQWVPHFLFLQSLMFMFSGEILWRYYEDNTIYEILKNLRFTDLTIIEKNSKKSKEDNENIHQDNSKDKNDKKNKEDKSKESEEEVEEEDGEGEGEKEEEEEEEEEEEGAEEGGENAELKIDNYSLDTLKRRQTKVASIAKVLEQRMEYNLNHFYTV
ncbi:innexin shaking-B-like isoform X2 [Rhodnius prolixus]|uniref:innexin shaking-B-like isoform X2 n=1 Tax=Rhodnius prolixus TaxID=13249 RepID=UPI003D18ACDD